MAVWNSNKEEPDDPPLLNTDEKIRLGNKICALHKDILSSWLRNTEMQKIYKKYDISRDEASEYISYF